MENKPLEHYQQSLRKGQYDMPYAIIYKVTNIKNGMIYIGATEKELEDRKKEHLSNRTHFPNYKFYEAINQYGEKSFKWEIIDNANSLQEKYDKEIHWIDYYRTFIGFNDCNGYNMTLGGGGQLGLSGSLSKNYGQTRSEDTKRLLSKLKIGENNPAYGKLNNLNCNFKDKIVAVNPYTKKVVVFESTMDAERKLNVSNSGIVQCLNNNKTWMFGQLWIRYTDFVVIKDNNTIDDWIEKKRNKMVKGKPFIGYQESSILFFDNLIDVKKYGFQPAHVNKCLRNVPKYKTHKGYKWKYIFFDEYGKYIERG